MHGKISQLILIPVGEGCCLLKPKETVLKLELHRIDDSCAIGEPESTRTWHHIPLQNGSEYLHTLRVIIPIRRHCILLKPARGGRHRIGRSEWHSFC
jgi:hypothetical protein